MDIHEKEANSAGYRFVAGVDEAGRGPLAGPVVAAAVIFPFPPPLDLGIKDSKALSGRARAARLFDIFKEASSVGVGIVWPAEIDRINILKASLKAMELAVGKLSIKPDKILVDGNMPINTGISQRPIISGDSLSVSIAAASIVAKTARDAIMESYHRRYPQYNFISNKGYPTREHLEAIDIHGPTPIHRRTFRGVIKGISAGPEER
ncbi:MAG TPA: ribonuclease HII [Deltaproteobacteria bacterium]|nr:MAG: ribonuclease HII [Deltaproteobacteria bacterium GWA2_55_82]OGQ63232.1 MAG: ribonuclease HII [Deltaproteobacteria bacterium RIFCSPLOWO2_02_FULL_55_12]OIJ73067.1 MAG: ribonuclease HII [Deltaproteobacteria bacterium GWC2_55_46]HBG47828.1 ribonuclease HII [Deltaproteobacteria bacterium]HCY11909.1 ribonuclease HII [Deltaproteobacteria bacterium]